MLERRQTKSESASYLQLGQVTAARSDALLERRKLSS